MRSGYLGLGSALLVSLFSAGSASAQRVSADIRIGGRGPISGHVRIESRDHYRDRYYRDYNYRPRQVRVEVLRRYDRGRHLGWFKQHRTARVVVVYYDRRDDCYYDRRFYPGLEEIRVYEDGGRYYRDDYDEGNYDDRRYDGRNDDGRYDDGRYDDRRYDDRNGGRNDGRYDGRNGGRDGRDRRDDRNRRDGRNW